MITRLLANFGSQRRANVSLQLQRKLIRHEAELGGQIFGSLDPGSRREFFCLDEQTWVWHHQDAQHERPTTTRYSIRPELILKSVNGQAYTALTQGEEEHLLEAIEAYRDTVFKPLYPSYS